MLELIVFALLLPLLLKENRFWSKMSGVKESQKKVLCFYIAFGFITSLLFPFFDQDPHLFTIASFCALLTSLSIIDARTQYIPNIYCFALAILGLGINTIGYGSFQHPIESIWAAFLSYFLMSSVNHLYKKYKHVDGLGMGDAKLLAALSCWFGFGAILPILFIANLLFVFVWFYHSRNNECKGTMAMGPYIAIAGFIVLFGEYNKSVGNFLNWL